MVLAIPRQDAGGQKSGKASYSATYTLIWVRNHGSEERRRTNPSGIMGKRQMEPHRIMIRRLPSGSKEGRFHLSADLV
jgi:hypothetical protein